MNPVEYQTDLLWTVAVGVGIAVLAVVIILLTLLLQAVRALDKRVDHVWSAAVGVFVHTLTAAPQLRAGERHAAAVESANSGAGVTAPMSVPTGFGRGQ
jgi:hypothetical protein